MLLYIIFALKISARKITADLLKQSNSNARQWFINWIGPCNFELYNSDRSGIATHRVLPL